MANPHFEIKITKRSKRQSAVAGAAYQSGENLFSEYDPVSYTHLVRAMNSIRSRAEEIIKKEMIYC